MINCWDNINGDGRGLPEPGRGGKGRGFPNRFRHLSRSRSRSVARSQLQSGSIGVSETRRFRPPPKKGPRLLPDSLLLSVPVRRAEGVPVVPPESPRPSLPDPDLAAAAGARRNRGKTAAAAAKKNDDVKCKMDREKTRTFVNPTHFKPVIQLTQPNPPTTRLYNLKSLTKFVYFLHPLPFSLGCMETHWFKYLQKPPETHAE